MVDIFEMLEKRWKMEFTTQQRQAIMHKDGPAFIVAIPGSGKTTVSVCRCASLIINHGVKPKNILSVTFSKASALDMENRLKELFENMVPEGIAFSTIHSFAYMVVREYSRMSGRKYTVIEDDKVQINKASLLKALYFNINKEYISDDKFEELINNIGFVKNMMINHSEFEQYGFNIPNFKEVYDEYEKYKHEHGYIDYDDMLTKAYEVLKSSKRMLEVYRRQYHYIQVDEGQDTSRIQHEIISLLSYPKNNIFIVADDDQSIYGFRGADPDQLLHVEKRYPGTKIYKIDQNFRSTNSIVSAADQFIRLNKERIVKNLSTQNEEGEPVRIIGLKDDVEQTEYIVKRLKESEKLSVCAVLFRNNISAIPVADMLGRKNIQFYLKDSRLHFFRHWVTQDINAFLKLSLDSSDIESFERIYYKMNAYISKQMLEYIKNRYEGESVFEILIGYPGMAAYQIERLSKLSSDFKSLKKMAPDNAIVFIEHMLTYHEYLDEYCKRQKYSIRNADMILSNLKCIAKGTDSVPEFLDRQNELREIMERSKFNKYKNSVTISTIHSAKGLEFDTVFMIDLIDEYFPNNESISKSEEGQKKYIEEERRLFYVGMTRAKKYLNLITLDSKNGFEVTRSRFVDELENILKKRSCNFGIRSGLNVNTGFHEDIEAVYKSLIIGSKVKHIKFGMGKVIGIDRKSDKIEIGFGGESKTLSLSMCMKNRILYLE